MNLICIFASIQFLSYYISYLNNLWKCLYEKWYFYQNIIKVAGIFWQQFLFSSSLRKPTDVLFSNFLWIFSACKEIENCYSKIYKTSSSEWQSILLFEQDVNHRRTCSEKKLTLIHSKVKENLVCCMIGY